MRHTRRLAAFTLVELLVVIGIIAALIGILLPVLSGVSARGRDVQCQSNIRQCVQLILTYASENKGQYPFGHYYVKSNPVTWDDDAGDGRLVTIWAIISRMSSKRYSGDDVFESAEAVSNSAPFLKCPEAMQVLEHICSYAGNLAAFPSPSDDFNIGTGPQPLITRPMKVTQAMPTSVLMWDTNVQPGMATDVGYVTSGDLDDARFWRGAATPEWRFFVANDPVGQINQIYGHGKPVILNAQGGAYKNIDPPGNPANGGFSSPQWPYQGNLRFRHSKNTAVNVGFADGHVGQFTGKFKNDGTPIRHDALRKNFMIKWPSGIGLQPTY